MFSLRCSSLRSAFSPADLTLLRGLMERSWAGTMMHGLTLTLQTLGFFLQSGFSPGHPPNHMVGKTTRLSEDRNLLQTKRGVFVWIWVGRFNYWMCMNEGVQEIRPRTVSSRLQKSWCFSSTVDLCLYKQHSSWLYAKCSCYMALSSTCRLLTLLKG